MNSKKKLYAMRSDTTELIIVLPIYNRRPIARLHGWLSENYPTLFGALVLEAHKASTILHEDATGVPLTAILRNPINHEALLLDKQRNVWRESSGKRAFPDLNGIPFLISKDAVEESRV